MELFARKGHILAAPQAAPELKSLLFLVLLQVDYSAGVCCLQNRDWAFSDVSRAQNVLLRFGLSLFDGEPDHLLAALRRFAAAGFRRDYEKFEYEVAFAEMFYCARRGLPLDSSLGVKREVVSLLRGLADSWMRLLEGILLLDQFRGQPPVPHLEARAGFYRKIWNQLRGSDAASIAQLSSPRMSAYLCAYSLAKDGQIPCRFDSSLSIYHFIFSLYSQMYDRAAGLLAVLRQFAVNFCQGFGADEARTFFSHAPWRQAVADRARGIFSASLLSGSAEDFLPVGLPRL